MKPARHLGSMANNPFGVPPRGPTIDMTPDGRIRTRTVFAPGAMKLTGVAALVAVVAGSLAVAALALWLALTLVPIALAAGLVAWVLFKIQRWQGRRAGPVDLYRR